MADRTFKPPVVTANDLLKYHRDFFGCDPPASWMQEFHDLLQSNEPLDPNVYFTNVPYMARPEPVEEPIITKEQIDIFRASEIHSLLQARERQREEAAAAAANKERSMSQASPLEPAAKTRPQDVFEPGVTATRDEALPKVGTRPWTAFEKPRVTKRLRKTFGPSGETELTKKRLDWANVEVTAENPWTARRHARESDAPSKEAPMELDYGD